MGCHSFSVAALPASPPNHVGNYPHARAFIKSVKERTPSVEDARFGHRAALASHMANRAYGERRRVEFDENTV